MEHEMTLALTALRANKDMLLTLMDVFVREPHLDWVSNGRYDRAVCCYIGDGVCEVHSML